MEGDAKVVSVRGGIYVSVRETALTSNRLCTTPAAWSRWLYTPLGPPRTCSSRYPAARPPAPQTAANGPPA